MALTLQAPSRRRALPAAAALPEADIRIALYGDLTCPWSYLASRRAAVLEADGVHVDWSMVEHDRPDPGRGSDHDARFEALRGDLDRVNGSLLVGERLPHALAGFVPYTRPAVSGYAEAYLVGVGPPARRLLFEAFWLHAVDLGDARLVRALLMDSVRAGRSPSELLSRWGYAVDVTGAPVTTEAWRLVRQWRSDWASDGEVVPVLVLGDGRRLHGVDAVDWLGAELVRRGLDVDLVERLEVRAPRGLADLSWTTQHGNRWLQARRDAQAPELFSRLRPWV